MADHLGYLLPQLLAANYAERLPRKKPFVIVLGGLGERVPYLLMGLVVLWLAIPAPAVTLGLFFLLLATTAASNGTATPAWFAMIGKVIPMHRRGLWSGLARSLGALPAFPAHALKITPAPQATGALLAPTG